MARDWLAALPAHVSELKGHDVRFDAEEGCLSPADAAALVALRDPTPLLAAAAARRDAAHGAYVSFSKKVFIPLTQLCRDVCHYCTFAQAPRALAAPFLAPEAVLANRAGRSAGAGCKEALFTLGDKPERRYGVGGGGARRDGLCLDA